MQKDTMNKGIEKLKERKERKIDNDNKDEI